MTYAYNFVSLLSAAAQLTPINHADDSQEEDASSRQYYIESLVVTDTNMVTYHGSVKLLKNYVLTLMNIVRVFSTSVKKV